MVDDEWFSYTCNLTFLHDLFGSLAAPFWPELLIWFDDYMECRRLHYLL
jgi:hypothetical protein